LIENQHAQQNALLSQDGQKFLNIVKKISADYPLHKKNLSTFAAHISTKKIDTDGMVFIMKSAHQDSDLIYKKKKR
jgi:hypothetical protein